MRRFMGSGEEAMIARAVEHARAVGVPEERIQRVIEQERMSRGGAVVPAVISGRLNTLAREHQQAARGD
jgi:hypothetical protein